MPLIVTMRLGADGSASIFCRNRWMCTITVLSSPPHSSSQTASKSCFFVSTLLALVTRCFSRQNSLLVIWTSLPRTSN
jgi:hypothetical protein